MKMKLLSPAGDYESLKAAVFYGADEVYLGIKDFNARNIETFDLDGLKHGVDFAHFFGVKVFLAVNILFDDRQLQDAVDLIVDSFNIGVDAFIIQDLGLADILHKNFPQIVLHASTQMGVHNLEGVQFLQKFGFRRVVLARETPLQEIKRIRQNSDVQIEYFVQGALCVSFSGNCYLSSYLCNASGNRGKCKQLCRLPYAFCYRNKQIAQGYLLSAKDFCMLDYLKQLQDAGVDSIKIEGRARRPYYVAVATDIYRKALDGKDYRAQDLKLAYNRDYTAGYFSGNGNIISNYNNHVGVAVGRVEKTNNGKRFNEIFFRSNIKISPKSTLKIFRDKKEVCTIAAFDLTQKNMLYRVTTKQTAKVGDEVRLITDFDQEKTMLEFCKRRKLNVTIFAIQNQPIKAVTHICGSQFVFTGQVCQAATNCPLSEQEIVANFAKSELFDCQTQVVTENAFLPKQALNSFRREFFEQLFALCTRVKHEPVQRIQIECDKPIKTVEDAQIVYDKTQKLDGQMILYSPQEYVLTDVLEFKQRCQKMGKKLYLDLPNFALQKDIEYLKELVKNAQVAVCVNNYYGLCFDAEKIAGGGINVYNSFAAAALDIPVIVAESDIATKVAFAYMTLRHCPIKQHLKSSCKDCKYRDGYSFVMQNGKKLLLKRKKMSTCTFYLIDEQ